MLGRPCNFDGPVVLAQFDADFRFRQTSTTQFRQKFLDDVCGQVDLAAPALRHATTNAVETQRLQKCQRSIARQLIMDARVAVRRQKPGALPGVEVTGFNAAQWFSGHRKEISDAASEPDPDADADAAESARRRAAQNAELLNGWRQLDELHQRRSRIAARDRGELTPAELELLDFYTSEIDSLRRLLQMLDDKSPGVENPA